MPGPDRAGQVVDRLGPHLGELPLPAPGPALDDGERAGSRPSARTTSATGGVRETTWIDDDGHDHEHQRTARTKPSPTPSRQPGAVEQATQPAAVRGRSRPARGTGTPTRSAAARRRRPARGRRPSARPASSCVHVDADPLEALAAAAACRRPARSSPPRRANTGSVSIDVALDPPGHRDDLVDPPHAAAGRCPRWTTRSTDAATVGTTNRAEMFSPASSGSVHILTSASRALLACSDAIPGSPAFRASSRSRHSSARTSPTMIRDGRIRRLSLTRSRSRTSPVPSSPACRVCIGTQSGCAEVELEDLLGARPPARRRGSPRPGSSASWSCRPASRRRPRC